MEMKIDNEKIMLALANNGMMLKDLCKKAGLSENAFRSIRQEKHHPIQREDSQGFDDIGTSARPS